MNALFVAAKEVCDFMTARKWQFCIIGGLAVQRWGEPRRTMDVDLTLLTGFGDEEPFARELLGTFKPRRSDALEFSLLNRVILFWATNEAPVDVSFGALPFEVAMLKRATPFEFAPGVVLPTCSAEDLLVMKAFAGRPHDWTDARGVVVRQKGNLNKRYILGHLKSLYELKETPEMMTMAEKVLGGK